MSPSNRLNSHMKPNGPIIEMLYDSKARRFHNGNARDQRIDSNSLGHNFIMGLLTSVRLGYPQTGNSRLLQGLSRYSKAIWLCLFPLGRRAIVGSSQGQAALHPERCFQA